MKKLVIIITTLLSFFNVVSYGQGSGVQIAWTDEMEKDKYLNFRNVLGKDAEGFFIVYENDLSAMSAGKQTAVIEKYDNNMKQLFRKELIVKFHDNEVAYYRAVSIKNTFYLFTTFWDNKEKIRYFLVNTISRNGEITGAPKVLFEMSEQGRGAPEISMRLSFDSSKVMLYTDLKDKSKEEESVYFKVFDQTLNPIWENKLVLPHNSKKFEIEKYIVDNSANVHILGKVKKEKEEKSKGESDFYYTLISYFYVKKEFKEFIPDVGDGYVSGINLMQDKRGNIVATGFYSEKSERSLKGVFYMKINPETRSIITQKIKPFDQEFLELFLSERKARKGSELYNYSIDNTIEDAQGNIIILAEEYYVQTYTYVTSNGSTYTRTVYNYNHIMAIKFSPSGDVLWWVKVPKRQSSGDATFFSYMHAVKGSNIYILYNEHKKNLDNLDPKKMSVLANPKEAVTVLVSIDPNGKMTKIPMFESKDDEGHTVFRPTTAKYLSDKEYLVLSTRKRKFYKLGKIVF